MYMMAGGSPRHSQIIARVMARVLTAADQSGCTAFSSDPRVKAGTSFFYPDVSVICGAVQMSDERIPSVTNPMLIVEVLSLATESFDRGRKLASYRSITSLQKYVLVSQDQPHVEMYTRTPENLWIYRDASGIDSSIALTSLDAAIALTDIYRNVIFDDPAQQS